MSEPDLAAITMWIVREAEAQREAVRSLRPRCSGNYNYSAPNNVDPSDLANRDVRGRGRETTWTLLVKMHSVPRC